MKPKSSGFTLIELLVVIAIIAILAAILFPVFARAREKARQSSCASNLKQISIGILQYTQDFDENYPPAMLGNWCDLNHSVWTGCDTTVPIINVQQLTNPYTKSVQIWKCPSANRTWSNYDYGYPAYMGGADLGPQVAGKWSSQVFVTQVASIKSESNLIMLTDMGDMFWNNLPPGTTGGVNNAEINNYWISLDGAGVGKPAASSLDPNTWVENPTHQEPFLSDDQPAIALAPGIAGPLNKWTLYFGPYNGQFSYDFFSIAPRHSGRVNAAFVDGHVKSQDPIALLNSKLGDPNCLTCNGN